MIITQEPNIIYVKSAPLQEETDVLNNFGEEAKTVKSKVHFKISITRSQYACAACEGSVGNETTL